MEINELFLKDEDLHRLCRNQKFLNVLSNAMHCKLNCSKLSNIAQQCTVLH